MLLEKLVLNVVVFHLAINCKNVLTDHCMPNPMMNAHLPYMPMFPNAPIH